MSGKIVCCQEPDRNMWHNGQTMYAFCWNRQGLSASTSDWRVSWLLTKMGSAKEKEMKNKQTSPFLEFVSNYRRLCLHLSMIAHIGYRHQQQNHWYCPVTDDRGRGKDSGILLQDVQPTSKELLCDQKRTVGNRNGSGTLPPVPLWTGNQAKNRSCFAAIALQADWTVSPSSEMNVVSSRIQLPARAQSWGQA